MNDDQPTREQVREYFKTEIAELETKFDVARAVLVGVDPSDIERLRILEAALVYLEAPVVARVRPMVLEPNPELEALLLRIGSMARAIDLEPPTRLEHLLRTFFSLPYAVRALFGFTMLALALSLLVDLFT